MKRAMLALAFVAVSAHAQVVATAGNRIVVAHDGRVELFDASANSVWSAEGVDQPSSIATSADSIAIVDSFNNRVSVVHPGTEVAERIVTGETPVDARFIGRDLYVLDRAANRLERVGGSTVSVAPDPAFMRAAGNMLYVYSRLDGVVQEIDPAAMRVRRTLTVTPFASDFEVDGRSGYLVDPRAAKLRTFSLDSMQRTADIATGAVPVDLAVTTKPNVLSASRLAIADPASKRVWVVEGSQSVARAFTRGFIRGLLGLGLFAPESSELPSGVDRVASRGAITVAYDSTTSTLYRITGSKPAVIAREVGPHAFAITDSAVAVWQAGRLRLIR